MWLDVEIVNEVGAAEIRTYTRRRDGVPQGSLSGTLTTGSIRQKLHTASSKSTHSFHRALTDLAPAPLLETSRHDEHEVTVPIGEVQQPSCALRSVPCLYLELGERM